MESILKSKKMNLNKEIEDYYSNKMSIESINAFVDYYDKLKSNKLDKKMGTDPNLPFNEHDFGKATDNLIMVITEVCLIDATKMLNFLFSFRSMMG